MATTETLAVFPLSQGLLPFLTNGTRLNRSPALFTRGWRFFSFVNWGSATTEPLFFSRASGNLSQNATSPARASQNAHLARQSPRGYRWQRQGWHRLYGLPYDAGRGFQGLDNSPEDGFLAAMGGCAAKRQGGLSGRGKRTSPEGLAKKETVSVRRRVANRDRPIPSVCRVFKRFRERRSSLVPRGSKAKTAAGIALWNTQPHAVHSQLSVPASGGMAGGGFQADKSPDERLLTAMGGCAAIEGRGYSTSPRSLTSRAPAVLPPWLNRSDGGGFFVGLADWGRFRSLQSA